MEVDSNGTPSLPANYLTLAQLQERWLKEQERKQIEKLNQERELQQQLEREENAEREGKQREEDDAQNRTQNGTTKEVAAAKTTHVGDRRNQHRRKAHKPRFEVDLVDDVAQVMDESRQQQQKKKKTKKKNSNWKKRNESRAAKMGAGETAEVQSAGETAEVQPEEVKKVVVEITQEVEGAKSNIQINRNESNRKGKQWVEKEKVLGDETPYSIVPNFEGLSVNGGKEGNRRPREGRNGRNEGYRRGSGRVDVHSKRPQGRRDGNYVWVKKGDSTDAGVNGVQC